jgi:hypothetical protein
VHIAVKYMWIGYRVSFAFSFSALFLLCGDVSSFPQPGFPLLPNEIKKNKWFSAIVSIYIGAGSPAWVRPYQVWKLAEGLAGGGVVTRTLKTPNQ